MKDGIEKIWNWVTDDTPADIDVGGVMRQTLRESRLDEARDDDYDVLTHDREAWSQLIRLGWDVDEPSDYTWKITPTGYVGSHGEYPGLSWDGQQWTIGPDPGYEGFALGEASRSWTVKHITPRVMTRNVVRRTLVENEQATDFYYRNEPEMESLLGDLTRSLDAVHTFVMERSATDPSTVDTIVDDIVDQHIAAWKTGQLAK